MKIVSIIPARGGSKGIPNKNIKDINGQPLISYNIEASIKSNIDETWISTDDDVISNISSKYGAKVLKRPEYLADDNASSDDVLLHFAENVEFDILVFLQCTSPLTTFEDINGAIKLLNTCEFDSVLSVCDNHGGWLCGGFTWEIIGKQASPDYDINNRPRRQDCTPSFRENGAIYVTTRDALLKSKCRISGDIGLYIMPRQRSFEIDEPEDLIEIRKFLNA